MELFAEIPSDTLKQHTFDPFVSAACRCVSFLRWEGGGVKLFGFEESLNVSGLPLYFLD